MLTSCHDIQGKLGHLLKPGEGYQGYNMRINIDESEKKKKFSENENSYLDTCRFILYDINHQLCTSTKLSIRLIQVFHFKCVKR